MTRETRGSLIRRIARPTTTSFTVSNIDMRRLCHAPTLASTRPSRHARPRERPRSTKSPFAGFPFVGFVAGAFAFGWLVGLLAVLSDLAPRPGPALDGVHAASATSASCSRRAHRRSGSPAGWGGWRPAAGEAARSRCSRWGWAVWSPASTCADGRVMAEATHAHHRSLAPSTTAIRVAIVDRLRQPHPGDERRRTGAAAAARGGRVHDRRRRAGTGGARPAARAPSRRSPEKAPPTPSSSPAEPASRHAIARPKRWVRFSNERLPGLRRAVPHALLSGDRGGRDALARRGRDDRRRPGVPAAWDRRRRSSWRSAS